MVNITLYTVLTAFCMYRVAQKSKLLHFDHIFSKYWPIFTIFHY